MKQGVEWKSKFYLVLVTFTLALLLIGFIQNSEVVHLRFLIWKFAVAKSILLGVVLVIGLALGFGLGMFSKSKR